MTKKTDAEIKAFHGTLDVGDRVKISWSDEDNQVTEWTGIVRVKRTDGVVIHYDGFGEFNFPYDGVTYHALTKVAPATGGARPLTMGQARRLGTGTELNALDITTWRPLLVSEATLVILMSQVKLHFRFTPLIQPTQQNIRKEFYFEREFLFMLLEAWCRAHLGPTEGYAIAPHNAVARLILLRLDALNEKMTNGGNIRQYMKAVTGAKDPPEFAVARAAAKAKKGGAVDEGADE
jgi:hypothetical protein